MESRAAITVQGAPDEIRKLWESAEYRPHYIAGADAGVSFKEAPGGRGTEIDVELRSAGGKLKKLMGAAPLAKVKDDLRHFKQRVETGEIPRSEGSPEGERTERKLKQRPAQPLSERELEKVGA